MSRLAAQRSQLATRLATVTTGNPVVVPYDALGQDLPGNTITIGVPSSRFERAGDPLGADYEVGRWGWLVEWPIVAYLALTPDRASSDLVDVFTEDVLVALTSDPTLGGSCVASSLDAVEATDDDPDQAARHHVLTITVTTLMAVNNP